MSKEDIKELAEKAKHIAITKSPYAERDFMHVEIYTDGTVGVVFSVGRYGSYEEETYEVSLEDLDKCTADLMAESVLEAERRKKKEEEARIEREKEEKEWKLATERAEYKRLKAKFENDKQS